MQPADRGGLSIRAADWLADATGDVLSGPTEQSAGHISLRSLDPAFLYDALAPILDSIELRPEALVAYGPTAGSPSLRELIARRVNSEPDDVVITDGASQALMLVLASVLNPDDRVLIPTPGLPAYRHVVRLLRGVPEPYTWSSNNDATVAALEAQLDASPRVLVLNSPHNPTGGVLDSADVVRLVRHAQARGVYVVLDDAYAWMAEDPDRLSSYAEVTLGAHGGLAAVCSLGKYLCLPGLRLGCALTKDRLVLDAVVELKRHLSQCSCPMQEQLAVNLLGHPRLSSAKTSLVSTLNHRRKRLSQVLTDLRSSPYEGGVGFYLFAGEGSAAEQHGLEGISGVVFGAGSAARRYSLAVSPAKWDTLERLYAV